MLRKPSKEVLRQYHHIAVDALRPSRPNSALSALLEAAEVGNSDLVQRILEHNRGIIDLKCSDTGDTALIAAARNSNLKVLKILLQNSADCTLQNDVGDSVLEVASPRTRKFIIDSIQHEGRLRSNAQGLLQSAWLGDAVSVRKSLSGRGIDVNCRNSDGMTPLLLVTKDLKLFDKVKHAMQTEYNPVEVVEELIRKQANVNACDPQGRSALHLVASNGSVHARKMVSLLLQNGSHIGSTDNTSYAPLHTASQMGHMAIVVALVEEGADVNVKTGENGDTPLMLSAREGHTETAKYLLSHGADITATDNKGESALTLASTPGMVTILKEAWTEQTKCKSPDSTDSSPSSTTLESEEGEEIESAEIGQEKEGEEAVYHSGLLRHDSEDQSLHSKSFFITNRQVSLESQKPQRGEITTKVNKEEEEEEEEEEILEEPDGIIKNGHHRKEVFLQSEVEADDELEYDIGGNRRFKPATKRAIIRQNLENTIQKRNSIPQVLPLAAKPPDFRPRLPSWTESVNYSSADEEIVSPDHLARSSGRQQNLHDSLVKQHLLKERRHGINHILTKMKPSDKTLSRSYDSLCSSPGTPQSPRTLTPVQPLRMTSPEQEKDKKITLPSVPGTSHPSSNRLPERRSVKVRSDGQLPALPSLASNMQPVALVSVDAEKDKLHVQQFGRNSKAPSTSRLQKQTSSKSKSRSTSTGGNSSMSRRRNTSSSGHHHQPQQQHAQDNDRSKHHLLPAVVSPTFAPAPPARQQQRQRPSRLSSLLSPRRPQLSSVNEVLIGHGRRQTVATSTPPTPDTSTELSSDSTLRASMNVLPTDQFEADSLERSMRAPRALNPSQQLNGGVASPQDNLMINYAVRDGSIPLSPIWNQLQYLRSESETSSSGDYITSYVGRRTPFPRHLLSSESSPSSKKQGIDSGHDDASGSSSEGEEDPMEEREELKWKKGRLLGKGAFGKVWEGLMDSAKLIAVKEVELDVETQERAEAQFSKLQLEVDILRSLSHKNIVKYWGADIHMATVFIFMEFIAGGSLQSIIKRFGSLDERTISHYTRQIVQGVNYLHNNGIIHRDIKGANIMVTQKGVIKLIDFGCAKRYAQEHSIAFHSVRGTPYWMAPEVIRGEGYGRKSDIWSVGCTVHEMATAKPPWGDLPPEAAMFQIGSDKPLPAVHKQLSEPLMLFVDVCMLRDSTKRPSAHELLDQSPFLNMPIEKPRRRN